MYFSYLIFALVVYSAAVDGQVTPLGFVHYEDIRGSLKLFREPASWRNARIICHNEGAVLASPETNEFYNAIVDIIKSSSPRGEVTRVYTGISDTLSKGLFYSLEGTPVSQIPVTWSPGAFEFRDESCLSLRYDRTLEDSKCSDMQPFICYEKDSVFPQDLVQDFTCGHRGYSQVTTTNSCYKFHKEGKYWKDAFATCVMENAHLAIINSVAEAIYLKQLFIQNFAGREDNDVKDVVHIGFVDWGKEGGLWMTIKGQPLEEAGFAAWHTGEPNNITNQFCGGLNVHGGLDDVNCYDGDRGFSRSFICEKSPKPVERSYNDVKSRDLSTDVPDVPEPTELPEILVNNVNLTGTYEELLAKDKHNVTLLETNNKNL